LYTSVTLTSLNKGWRSHWFYLRNNDGRLPKYTKQVVTAAGEHWWWGMPQEHQAQLQPLLDALWRLRDQGLTAPRVVIAFHYMGVLPLVEKHLRLDEKTSRAFMESSRMALAALSTDEPIKRIKGTMGKVDYNVPVPMHPE
jgi:hypothetical protein